MRTRGRWITAPAGLLAVLALMGLTSGLSASALAATITVGPTCTLANAIASANANADTGGCTHQGTYGDDLIVLPGGTLDLTTVNNGANALPVVNSNITIVGNGSTIRRPLGSAAPFFRFFQVSGGHLKLLDLTLTGGLVKSTSNAEGGAVRVTGSASLTLARVTLSGNTADGSEAAGAGHRAKGGAIFFDANGALTLTVVTLTNNLALATGSTNGGTARGGAILVGDDDDRGSLSMTDVTATGNSAIANGGTDTGGTAEGAVVYYEARSVMIVTRGTFTGNSAIANGGGNHGGGTRGGAIYFEATDAAAILTLASVIASGNTLSAVGAAPGNGGGAEGGGLYFKNLNGTGLSVRDSTFSNNTLNVNAGTGQHGGGAEGGGASINAAGTGTITIIRSAFTGNTMSANGGTTTGGNGGSADGGGIAFPQSGNLTLIAVTVAFNSGSANAGPTGSGGSSDGGGIYFNSSGVLALVNTTIVGNTGSALGNGTSEGGGVYLDFGSATLRNSIFAANTVGGALDNCSRDNAETFTSLGNNLFDNATGCGASGPGDRVGAPGLGPLTDTGQPGGIHLPLQAGSQALNNANASACPTLDQLRRPREGTCDIGAVESIGSVPSTTLLAAVLPSSRAGLVGNLLTAFVTVINSGATPAFQVGIGLGTGVPAVLSFQTTNPATNALTGIANTPVDIAPGATQTFVVALLATGAFDPTDLTLTYAGVNTDPVAPNIGLNTLLVSASLAAIADVIALSATAGGNGIVDIPGNTGTGVFSVATVNLGATDSMTVGANTGAVTLPVAIFVCQTDPITGVCTTPLAPTVTTTIATNATPTFAVFVAGSGAIAFNPASNRIFVFVLDSSGKNRGGTSVAVRTVSP